MNTKELVCTCKHNEQDKMYGKGIRLHNLSEDKTKAKCTVCNSVKQIKPIK